MKSLIATLFLLFANVAISTQLQLQEDCTLIAIGDTHVDKRSLNAIPGGITFACQSNEVANAQLSSRQIYPIKLTKEQQKQLEDDIQKGVVVSGETTIKGTEITGNEIAISGIPRYGEKQVKRTSAKAKKSLLVVRVTDKDGKVIPHSAAVVGDNVFGTGNDKVNLKSQMFDCSYGNVDFTNKYTSPNLGRKLSAPGVLDVRIPISITTNDRYTIHNAVTVAAEKKLGYGLPGQHDYVMYVIERCYVGCGWAAYAYINYWLSVYQDMYYSYTGVQMHELGHNLGMYHSGGLDNLEYTDHTCLMGNPLYSDEIGKMCFNPAKSWGLGWYDNYKVEVDITKSTSQTITMVGVAEIKVKNNKLPALLKLENGTNEAYFLTFNRATGINSDNDEADDEVTIIQVYNYYPYFSQSFLKAHLVEGESYVIGKSKITATKINTNTKPGRAIVTISDNSCEGLSKFKCKKAKRRCSYGPNKIHKCKRLDRFNHNCSQHKTKTECLQGDHAKLCSWKYPRCYNACENLNFKQCKRRTNSEGENMCKTSRMKNPCSGCKSKSCSSGALQF